MASPQPEGDLRDHTSLTLLSPHSFFLPIHLTFSPRWRSRPVLRHIPSMPVSPYFTQSWNALSIFPSASLSSVFIFYLEKENPLRPSMRNLLHFFRLLIRAGIEPHASPIQDPCSVYGCKEHAFFFLEGGVAFLLMVCDQCCHRRCAGIHSTADYRWLAPWSCPTCTTPVPTAAPTREIEYSDMERARSTLFRGLLSQSSLFIGPRSPAQPSTSAPEPDSKGGIHVPAVQLQWHTRHTSTPVISSSPPPHPRPRLLRATLKSSIHRILRGMRVRGWRPQRPFLSSLEAPWRRAHIPWPDASYEAGWLGRWSGLRFPTMYSGLSPYQCTQSNICCLGPIDVPSPSSDPRLLLMAHELPPLSRLGRWPHMPSCPDCHATDHTLAHLFSCHAHPTDLSRRTCGWQLSR